MAVILFLALIVVIAFLFFIAINSTFGAKFVLSTLSLYWFLGYFLRPILIIYSQDNDIRSPIHDTRLIGTEANFNNALTLIILGCYIFCFSLLFQKKTIWSSNIPDSTLYDFQKDSWVLTYGTTIGLLSQSIELTPFQNPFSKSIAQITVPIFCAYLWKRRELHLSDVKSFYILTTGLAGTIIMAFSNNVSKGILLSPLIIYMWKLSLWKEKRITLKKLVVTVVIPFSSVALFTLLQNIKLGTTGISRVNMNSDSYPWFLRPFLVVSDRFDAFTRVVDAIYAQGKLGGYKSWLAYVLQSLSWNPSEGRNETSFGQIWNRKISEVSVPGSRESPVSTAQGMIAEGYIWSGFTSLIIECIVCSFIFVMVGKYLEGNFYRIIFGFSLIDNFTLFESGLVQFSAALSGSIKIALFLWFSKHIYYRRR